MGLSERQEIPCERVAKGNIILCPCINVKLIFVIPSSMFGPPRFHAVLTREIVLTLSPERTTCFPSTSELYRDDLVQWTRRLFFLLRCSCLRAFAWVCRMASAAPKTEAKATMNDNCCDILADGPATSTCGYAR